MNDYDNSFTRKVDKLIQNKNDFDLSQTTFVFKTTSSVNETFEINL